MEWGVFATPRLARAMRVSMRQRAWGGLIGSTTALSLILASPSVAAGGGAPSGMVPYDHPVFHNGKRVLWHWAGRRGRGSSRSERTESAKTGDAPKSDAPKPPDYNFSVFSDGDDACAFRMAGDIVTVTKAAGFRVRPTVGRTAASQLSKLAGNDIADFVVAPVDALVDDPKASWKDHAAYVMSLGLERVEIVAGRDIAKVADLNGKKVVVGLPESADETVAAALFDRLGVKPDFVRKSLGDGLVDLAAGRVAAVVATGESESKALGDFNKDGKAHLVPLPMTPALAAFYSPLTLTAKERPNFLSGPDRLATLGAPVALVAMDAPANSARAARDALFVSALFDKLPGMATPDYDPNWRDVNIASTLDWPRLAGADAWIAAHRGEPDDGFSTFRSVAAGDGAPDGEKLFEVLMKARSANP